MAAPSKFNTTIEQFSPLITYEGNWRPGAANADNFFEEYQDGFFLTNDAGTKMTFHFTGTGVWLFGAMRPNHGRYEVVLDGSSQEFDGFATESDRKFKHVLWGAAGLPNTEHTVELINRPSEDRPYLDIDFITFEQEAVDNGSPEDVEANDPRWKFTGGWSNITLPNAQNDDVITSTESSSVVNLDFEGDNVQVIGMVGRKFGSFRALIDDNTSTFREVNCTWFEFKSRVLLYSASSLGAGNHSLRVEKLGPDVVELDFVAVRGSPGTDDSSSSDSPPVAAIVGGVVSGVVLLLAILIIFLWRRRTRVKSAHGEVMAGKSEPLAPTPYRNIEVNNPTQLVQSVPPSKHRGLAQPPSSPSVSSGPNTSMLGASVALTTLPQEDSTQGSKENLALTRTKGTPSSLGVGTTPSSGLDTRPSGEYSGPRSNPTSPLIVEANPPPDYWHAINDSNTRSVR